MSNRPKVTVLMTVLNAEPYLPEAIESILGQSLADFEFLVVDDGSSDGSAEVIEGYADRRIRLVRNDENQGVAASSNLGLDLATGEYIARMDADDIADPRRLAVQTAFLDANPDLSICGAWIETFGMGESQLWKYPLEHDDIKAALLFHSAMAHPAATMRTKDVRDTGLRYDTQIKAAIDYRFFADAAERLRLHNLPEALLRYRIHPRQNTQRLEGAMAEKSNVVREVLLKKLGLITGEEQVQLHADLVFSFRGFDGDKLERAGKWLEVIHQANQTQEIYQPEALQRLLSRLWVNVCKYSSCGLREAWAHYRAFPMSRWGHASLTDKARLALRKWVPEST